MAYVAGEPIGPYRVVSQLGQGGMATVYKAYDPELDRHVAIKVMHEAFKEDPNFLERFRREARIIARLEHPNIVPIYSFSEHRGDPYIVMKFIDGETLKVVLGYGPLTLDEVMRVLDGVAAGLTYAHRRGVLHRDIKPSNIMIDHDNVVYLTDFGLARLAELGASTLSQDMMLGTPHYISPEQAQGQTNLDPRTDVYSLGVVLYQLVVGRVPFMGDTPFSIVHDHIYTPLPMPTTLNPEVPPQVEAVLLRALAKNRDERYESAEAVAAVFKEAVRAARMTELPASVALPALDTTQTDVVREPVVDTPAPAPPAEPAVLVAPDLDTPTPTVARRVENRYGQYWMLGGIGAFVVICMLFAVGVVGAFRTAIPGSAPIPMHELPGQATPSAFGDLVIPTDPDTLQAALREAQRIAEANPQDPVAQFNLMLLNLAADPEMSPREAVAPFLQAVGSDKEMMVSAARILAEREKPLPAALVYLHALDQYPDDAALREEAGAYLWRLAGSAGRASLPFLREAAESSGKPGVRVIYARVLINMGGALQLRQARQQLEMALAQDGAMPEAHLALGQLYLAQNNPTAARDELQFTVTAPDAPAWVREEAQRLMDEHNLLDR